MISTYHVLFWKRDKKKSSQQKKDQTTQVKGGVQTTHGTVPLQQPKPSHSTDPTAQGTEQGSIPSVPKNVNVNSIKEPTHEQQLAKKPPDADKPSDIAPGGKPSERPLIETADGSIKKRYSPKEVAQAQVKTQKEQEKEEFEAFLTDSNKVLFSAKTVFPFDLFPDSIVVDMSRLNIVTREFFNSARIHSLDLGDISDVFVDTGPFLSTVQIQGKGGKLMTVRNLKTTDATRLRRVIQGAIMLKAEKIDMKDIPEQDLRQKIEEIGSIKAA